MNRIGPQSRPTPATPDRLPPAAQPPRTQQPPRAMGVTEAPAPARPASLAPALEPVSWALGDANRAASHGVWMKHLAERGGRGYFAPLGGELDPRKELVVIVPGNGENYQDLHALAGLREKYQVVVASYDKSKPFDAIAGELAQAFEETFRYRSELARAQGLPPPDRSLKVIGHSYGGLIAQSFLKGLRGRGWISEAANSPLSHVKHISMDPAWRGTELPVPGLLELVSRALVHLPLPRTLKDSVRLIRCGLHLRSDRPEMREVTTPVPSRRVTTQFVTACGEETRRVPGNGPQPVSNWYAAELRPEELAGLYAFLQGGGSDLDALTLPGGRPAFALRNLLRVLGEDADAGDYLARLRTAAREAKDLKDFGARYDKVLDGIVTPFQGQHTRFMWEDKRFMPWLLEQLAA